MIQELDIKNYALIDKLKIRFSPGLNILTGETGAGKSIIIGAMGLVLGDRASPEMIRTGSESAYVRASFDLSNNQHLCSKLEEFGLQNEDDQNTLIISREVWQSGRSRCLINDKITTLSTLREIGNLLVDIHGQHEHQTLLQKDMHLQILDEFAGLTEQVSHMQALYERLTMLTRELNELSKQKDEMNRQKQFIEFQIEELERAKLDPQEEDGLLRERQILMNSELIFELTSKIYDELYGGESGDHIPVLGVLKDVRSDLNRLCQIDPELRELLLKLESVTFELEDITRLIKDYRENVEFDPKRLSAVESRLDLLYRLKKKYGKMSVDELVKFKHQLQEKLKEISVSSNKLNEIKEELELVFQQASDTALDLSRRRKYFANEIKRLVEEELEDLGMERTVFQVEISHEMTGSEDVNGICVELEGQRFKLSEKGIDIVEFLISPNVGEELRPLVKIASGGEISRLMLALKSVLLLRPTRVSPETMIFDEIDTGIGGRIAEVVGRKLKRLATDRQVICITHLPQIASLAETHHRVQKLVVGDRTIVDVRELDEEERINEIARMLAGEQITEVAVAHAREMLENASQLKEGI